MDFLLQQILSCVKTKGKFHKSLIKTPQHFDLTRIKNKTEIISIWIYSEQLKNPIEK
jgi:hypothetical protein